MGGTKRKRPLVPTKDRVAAADKKPATHKFTKSKQHVRTSGPQASTSKPRSEPSGWTCGSMIDQQAAGVVERLLRSDLQRNDGVTLKSLVLAPHVQAKKATYAVTCETLKHAGILRKVLEASELAHQHEKLSEAVALVLLQELLFGKGLKRNGPAERLLLSNEAILRDLLKREQQAAEQEGPSRDHEAAEARPRWARINLLKMQPTELRKRLQDHAESVHLADQVQMDDLLPDLVRFPPGTELHSHPLVQEGFLILQSKASCMPAHALGPKSGWQVIDCCAAPGNKTTHVAALLSGGGRVYAFDRDPKRLKRLQANASLAGAANIKAELADFLTIDPEDRRYSQVKGVILDPSCSGSGTSISRLDYLLPSHQSGQVGLADRAGHQVPEGEEKRVEQLAKFQEVALRHALQFPALQRLVYSTCSVYQRENEDVVAAVLPDAQALGFELQDPFPKWKRRGLPNYPGCEKLVRTDPYEDETDGFFVAAFQRGASATGYADAAEDAGQAEQHAPAGPTAAKTKKKQDKKRPPGGGGTAVAAAAAGGQPKKKRRAGTGGGVV